jgi:Protein of unknown function (DUF998)
MASSHPLELTSAAAAALWLIIITLLPFTKPGLDPRTRMISEYAREPHGWIMQLAFLCMALSCSVLAAAIWALPLLLGPALLTICSVGFAGAGIFVTDPVFVGSKNTDPKRRVACPVRLRCYRDFSDHGYGRRHWRSR